MNIVFRQDESVHTQIADHFQMQIALGKLRPGDRLPAIRELARQLKLNPGTVARAYYELERQGIINTRRGGGSFVSTSAGGIQVAEQRQKRLTTLVERAILEAMGLGFTTEEIESSFVLRLADWRERRAQSGRKKATPAHNQSCDILFYGSHDLAIELLASHLATLYPGFHFTSSFVGSLAGLMALEYREADIAGAHLLDTESGEFNTPFVRRLMPNETVVLMNLAQRVQGLILAKDNPKHVTGIPDLKRPEITFVNRQKGSGTRILLDSQLLSAGILPSEIKGYEREEKTHVAVATFVARGGADVGLGTESAANLAGLDFIPLFKERYDLITLSESFIQPKIQKIHEVIRSESFQKMLRAMPGYDLSDTGKITTITPKQK